jgi:hypothetical protein
MNQMENTMYRFGELRKVGEDIDQTRTVEFVISNETRDRHGTVIPLKAWRLDNYKRNPVVGYNHNIYGSIFSEDNPDNIIGRAEVFTEGKQLIGRVTFEPPEINPLAEKIFQKVKFGTLRTASVGFASMGEPEWGRGREAEDGENPTQYFRDVELLEWSIVNIPSNPSAVKRQMGDDITSLIDLLEEKLEGKYERTDIEKMTLKGLVGILTGESVEADRKEEEDTKRMSDAEQLELLKLKSALTLHDNGDTKIKLADERARRNREREQWQLKVNLNIHTLKQQK